MKKHHILKHVSDLLFLLDQIDRGYYTKEGAEEILDALDKGLTDTLFNANFPHAKESEAVV